MAAFPKIAATAVMAGLSLAGCAREAPITPPTANIASTDASYPPPGETAKTPERRTPELPSRLSQTDLVGRWGYASYLRIEDRDRTIAAAEKSCATPYLIGQGQHGGVVMHLADDREAHELTLKGSSDGYDYVGPEGPAGGPKDREISSYDGRVMTMRFVNPEIAGRYGTSVYVRCDGGTGSIDAALPSASPPQARTASRTEPDVPARYLPNAPD